MRIPGNPRGQAQTSLSAISALLSMAGFGPQAAEPKGDDLSFRSSHHFDQGSSSAPAIARCAVITMRGNRQMRADGMRKSFFAALEGGRAGHESSLGMEARQAWKLTGRETSRSEAWLAVFDPAEGGRAHADCTRLSTYCRCAAPVAWPCPHHPCHLTLPSPTAPSSIAPSSIAPSSIAPSPRSSPPPKPTWASVSPRAWAGSSARLIEERLNRGET